DDMSTERQRALQILRRIERESAFAAPLLAGESGFVRTLVLGVLRWRSRLDFVVSSLAKRKIDESVLDVLRLGAYQLLHMDVARYAAVAETVELAPKHARGFVNAVLRRVTDVEPPDLATRTAHPPWLIARWIRNYGEERAARIAAADQELSYPDVITTAPPADATPSALVPGMWKLRGSSAEVEGIVLDEGSAVIADIAAATSNDILDLAAAPGGKSIVAAMRGAHVISNDISIGRLRVPGVVGDARQAPFKRTFDTVLLDAPCSATGTIRKNPELKWRLREEDLPAFAKLQRELLASAMTLAKRYVVYSTCSLEPEENDEIVAGYERADVADFVNDNVRRWVEDGVLRLTPDSGADGFTAFVLRIPPHAA
ncbi:MAG TPA: transcription antitermination factor NusB, partial [Thermoanaerobaculia bacterium]|nr:transcription antitermination factor NusB [Thermoanaerobaculia bacterium]